MINKRIKELRNLEKLSLQDFGSKIGYAKSTLSMIEKGGTADDGGRPATDKLINAIVSEFDVNEDWLRNGIGEIYNEPMKKKRDMYAKVISAMEKAVAQAQFMNFMLYFEKKPEDKKKVDEFDFNTFFAFSENQIRAAEVSPLELVNSFIKFYTEMVRLLSFLERGMMLAEELGYGKTPEVLRLEKSISNLQETYKENLEHFRQHIQKHDTDGKMIHVTQALENMIGTLDYKQQIDVKNMIREYMEGNKQ